MYIQRPIGNFVPTTLKRILEDLWRLEPVINIGTLCMELKLFLVTISEDNFNKLGKRLLNKYINDELCVKILLDLERRKPNLLAYLNVHKTPTTTNLIECFNSHLNIRLKSVKGFESFNHAKLWLNGYFVRRRLKPFTDCTGIFRRLNGKCSLSESIKTGVDLPSIF